ncbi:MAG: hypothetical protein AAF849_20475 [Bacteroidota bacterium]
MAKKDETASFVLRFNQKIFENEMGESQVQWRGNIRHVQGGDEKRFSEFDEVVKFMQSKLADLTISAIEDKTPEEQKGVLAKSFDLWKRVAVDTPKMVLETIKDPAKGVAQIQTQINQVSDAIGQKFESTLDQLPDLDALRRASKEDTSAIIKKLDALTLSLERLDEKVEQLKANQDSSPQV